MSNFAFLENEWPEIYQAAQRVEAYVQTDPRTACFQARRTLELTVQWLYAHDRAFRQPYDNKLAALLHAPSFQQNVPNAVYDKAQLVRREGNIATHSKRKISKSTAMGVLVELHHILYWLARTYTRGNIKAIPDRFDERLLPKDPLDLVRRSVTELKRMKAELQARDEAILKEQQERAKEQQEKAKLQAQLDALQTQKTINKTIPDTHDYSEAKTREQIIDVMLREAGWDPTGPKVAEYPVTGMPHGSGTGYVDYVLWGDDGLPLGLVEAKRTSVDPERGQQQALLYATCLEQMHGQRPIIFYTNGHTTYLWDDERYPPRQVQGFYTKDELMLLIQRRRGVQPLADISINADIVNRPYQIEAIRQMTAHFTNTHRKGLLVMATGSGKTRVTIALVDLLMRAGWVKRVLFLADRSALVRQATGAFKHHLPGTNPVNLLEDKEREQAPAARVVVSTYHTMMNIIDETNDLGQKLFSVGHFDLVVIDEAHRSVYQKFGAIFTYFDSLLVGLTATPKDEVDRNTYHLFNLEDGVPTFAYHLEEAIADGFLVPFQAYALPTKFIREGIKYDELSEDEKVEWDLIDWGDSDDVPDSVNAGAINAWLFNEDTVDRILQALMEHGLKVAGGDRLGKTIIFAKNHKHAKYIEKRFNVHYPQYRGHFGRVIDHQLAYAQTAIDGFSNSNKAPHIAISVDMLDTGIDIPEVVNLVFFKVVRSKTKFFQMIGRGTRLSPDLFGPGEDKTHFLIFDACMNFEFFSQYPEGVKSRQAEPLSQSLFKKRLTLLQQTRQLAKGDPTLEPMTTDLADVLHRYVAEMNTGNFIVRPHRAYVEPFQDRTRWEQISRAEAAQLAKYVSGLPSAQTDPDETAKRFDLMVIDLQLAHLEGARRFNTLQDKIIGLAANLETKINIPRVEAQLDLIQAIQTESFWSTVSLPVLEDVRQRLRELVIHADKAQRQDVYTAFKDTAGIIKEVADVPYSTTGVNVAQYKKKVEQFIREHEDYVAIQKIHWGIPLKSEDLAALEAFFYEAEAVGGQAQFVQMFGPQENLATFIRSLVGLDRRKAKERFAQFLDGQTYTAEQIRFVNYIIDHLTRNGTIDPELLYDQPYTDIHYEGLTGVFTTTEAKALLDVVQNINVVIEGS